MTTAAQALSAALLHFVWQGILVAFLLSLVLFLLRRRSPEARYLASCAALVLMVALPAVTALVSYQPASSVAASGISLVTRTVDHTSVPAPQTGWLALLQTWALPVWSMGVLVCSMRLLFAWKQVSTLRRRGGAPDATILASIAGLATRMGVARPVHALISSLAECPSVVGWIRPVILLPASALAGLTPEQLEAVLAHEMAHIRRHDYLVNVLQSLVETVLFYHPAVWWVSARIRHERELCCDDLAVRSCGDPVCYARALTRLERLRAAGPTLALGSNDGPLADRVHRLLGLRTQGSTPSKLPGLLALGLAVACFALNIHWAKGQDQERRITVGQNYLFVGSENHDAPGVSVNLSGADVLHRTGVEYPEAAAKKGVAGTVTLEVNLDAAGNVIDGRVLSGPPELRKSALQSVLNWHFAHDSAGGARQVSIQFDSGRQTARGRRDEPSQDLVSADERVKAISEELEAGLQLDILRRTYTDSFPKIVELKNRIRTLEEQRAALESADQNLNIANDDMEPAQAQLLEVRRALENQQRALANSHDNLERAQAELRIQVLRSQLDALQRNTVTLENITPDNNEGAGLRVRTPDTAHIEGDALVEEPHLAGRKLAAIQIAGLSAQARSDLLSRLTVRTGDTLSQASIEAATAAIRDFDEHLEVSMETVRAGVVLRISAPGAGQVYEFRSK
jgi:TonB family protein